jgi:predicted PurR-regulated permease PerM
MHRTPSFSKAAGISGILIALAAAVVILAGIREAASVLGPLLLSVYLMLIFGTLLHWFERKGISSLSSLGLTLVIFFAIMGVFLVTIAGSFLQFLSDLPGYVVKLESSIEQASPFLVSIGIDPATLTFENVLQSYSTEIRGMLGNILDIASPLVLIVPAAWGRFEAV